MLLEALDPDFKFQLSNKYFLLSNYFMLKFEKNLANLTSVTSKGLKAHRNTNTLVL